MRRLATGLSPGLLQGVLARILQRRGNRQAFCFHRRFSVGCGERAGAGRKGIRPEPWRNSAVGDPPRNCCLFDREARPFPQPRRNAVRSKIGFVGMISGAYPSITRGRSTGLHQRRCRPANSSFITTGHFVTAGSPNPQHSTVFGPFLELVMVHTQLS